MPEADHGDARERRIRPIAAAQHRPVLDRRPRAAGHGLAEPELDELLVLVREGPARVLRRRLRLAEGMGAEDDVLGVERLEEGGAPPPAGPPPPPPPPP